MTDAASMLSLSGVNAGYGAFQSLFDISLEISPGEAVAVIGPNGAGKTTLMRVISGILPAWSGSMRMEHADLRKVQPHRILELGISHVPENRRLFPAMSVEDNLRLGAYPGSLRSR
ncbi:MAG: ATP-binding cassette domain-containing protein, partial [Planctomycetales bacterium]|nr:ATP-binding cassette domain-containing protein [Planctomycetales bacterium]